MLIRNMNISATRGMPTEPGMIWRANHALNSADPGGCLYWRDGTQITGSA